ncbi:hypothetical protein M9H77_03913 [Catharanthus roseus]|uniref:Uncharacterized protein n=1 Tax=Catharanthus roseus TaxID=4058 RepID=A0ACC0CCL9_CATRO|nr:hypothetical protein M9H77_03913 [Catharanthus roseus]
MKKKRSNHSKIKALKTLKTYVLVRDVLRMHPNLSVSISVEIRCPLLETGRPERAHPIFLYKKIGRPLLETDLDYSGFGKSLGVDSR